MDPKKQEAIVAAAQGLPADLVEQHLARMPEGYFEDYPPAVVAAHVALIAKLAGENRAEVAPEAEGPGRWKVTIVAFDYMAELSTICGLLSASGVNILSGDVYTYADASLPAPPAAAPYRREGLTGEARLRALRQVQTRALVAKRKIVDIFHVEQIDKEAQFGPERWAKYESELERCLALLDQNQYDQVRQEVINRVCDFLRTEKGAYSSRLFPVQLDVDNAVSPTNTVIEIRAQDSPAFLYELSNALSMRELRVEQVKVQTVGHLVQDRLYITDRLGKKITDERRLNDIKLTVLLIKQFTHLLPQAPDPRKALRSFGQLVDQIVGEGAARKDLLIVGRADVMDALARLFGVSEFLWEDFLRMQHQNLFPVLKDLRALEHPKPRQAMAHELERALHAAHDPAAQKAALNSYKDREMFRIDMRHIQGKVATFDEFSSELTDLAEVVIGESAALVYAGLEKTHGRPICDDGRPCVWAALALGKCGGRELGYGSDIELLFVYRGAGRTTGPLFHVTCGEFHERFVGGVRDFIIGKREGIFEIDLRLRPHGKKGPLATTLENFRHYFTPGGGSAGYERQALIKLRWVAGDEALGRQVEGARDEIVFGQKTWFDLAEMLEMRKRQIAEHVPGGQINVKLSPGALVDVEYLVQALQVIHGGKDPAVRATNTLQAMRVLVERGHLASEASERLEKAYTFLRVLIDSLRIVRGNARDLTLPPHDSDEFKFLARRVYRTGDDATLEQRLTDEVKARMSDVRELTGNVLK